MFSANLTKLLSGNVIAQVIAVIAIPVITRLYSVEAYGVYAIILALTILFLSVSSLGMHYAILVPESRAEALSLLGICFLIVTVFCFFLVWLILNYKVPISHALGIPVGGNLIYSVPVLVFLQSFYLILTYWCVREKKFGSVSSSKVIEGGVDRGGAIFAAIINHSETVFLVVARAISQVLSSLYLLRFVRHSNEIDSSLRLSYPGVIYKYRRYIYFNGPSMLLVSGMLQLPTIIFAALYSPAVAGLYAISYRLVSIPVSIIGDAISKTYTQHVAGTLNNSDLDAARINTQKLFHTLFSILLVPFSMLVVLGPDIFSFLLGVEWEEAGTYARYLSFFALTTLLTQAFSGLYDVIKRQKTKLKLDIVSFIVRIGVLFVCARFDVEILHVVVFYAIASIITNLYSLQVLFSYIGCQKLIINAVTKNMAYVLVFSLSSYILFIAIENTVLRVMLVFVACTIWLLLIIKSNKDIMFQLGKLRKRMNLFAS